MSWRHRLVGTGSPNSVWGVSDSTSERVTTELRFERSRGIDLTKELGMAAQEEVSEYAKAL